MKSLAKFLSRAPRGAQASLARFVGVHDSTVLRWERGEILPEPKIQERIAAWMQIEKAISRIRNERKTAVR